MTCKKIFRLDILLILIKSYIASSEKRLMSTESKTFLKFIQNKFQPYYNNNFNCNFNFMKFFSFFECKN